MKALTLLLLSCSASANVMDCDSLVKIAEYAYDNPYSPNLQYYREASPSTTDSRLFKAHNLFVEMRESGLSRSDVLFVAREGCQKRKRG